MKQQLQRHPLSRAFGDMTQEEFDSLEASCLMVGIQDAICLLDGMVLDGWHRYQVHVRHPDLTLRTFNLSDETDPVEFVLAKNKDRRHLTASQKALAVAEVSKWRPPHRPKENKSAVTADLSGERPETPPPPAPKSTRELANIAGVGTRTMEHAKAIVKHAAPEVKDAVKEGRVSVEKAADIARLPKDEQVVALIDPQSAPAVALKAENRQEPDAAPAPAPTKKAKAASDDTAARIAELEAEVAELREKNAALSSMIEEINGDLESAQKVIDADPGPTRLKAALEEAKRHRDYTRTLEDRINGLQNEKNMAIQQAKSFKTQVERLERAARRATH